MRATCLLKIAEGPADTAGSHKVQIDHSSVNWLFLDLNAFLNSETIPAAVHRGFARQA